MARINPVYGRDLDLNLLRVFVVAAETGSVTAAAARLYLTQPAVSAALKRLAGAVGAPLFVRQGRGVALSGRGQRLFARVRPLLDGLVDAALAPAPFDATTSERIVRLGLSDAAETWLLPPLLKALETEAPHLRLIIVPVQFRTVGEALQSLRIDLAVTVADDLPAGTRRRALFAGGHVCLYDPTRIRLPPRPTLAQYLAHEHVIVSYNGDLRGVVEDLHGVQRRVRCSVASFQNIGAIVAGSRMVATVPELVAQTLLQIHPQLRTAAAPFPTHKAPLELIWREAIDDDDACRFVRERIERVGAVVASGTIRAPRRRR